MNGKKIVIITNGKLRIKISSRKAQLCSSNNFRAGKTFDKDILTAMDGT
jgi:hypothetical protein